MLIPHRSLGFLPVQLERAYLDNSPGCLGDSDCYQSLQVQGMSPSESRTLTDSACPTARKGST